MKKHLLCVVITILFVACDSTNDLGTLFTKGQEVTLTAIIGEQRPQLLPGKQRVSGVDAGEKINLVWDNGDKILVKVGDHPAEFTLSGGVGTGEGTFTGIMPADGTSFHVEYPIDYSDDVLKVQQYVPNGFGKGLMKMSTKQAGTMDNGFTLSADNALLGLQLTGNRKIGKIVLSRNNAEGKAGSESYTLLCPNVMLSATPTLFYIVVLPGTWEKGFTVEFFASDNSVVIDKFVKTSSITFGTDMATIMPEKNVQNPPKRIGIFSVGEGKYISFSQGNLQYIQSTKTWQFAKEQWEYIGEANMVDGTLADCIDLFDWSGVAGISFNDWGTNEICGDAPNTWRTLSHHEWKYLLHDRPHATELLLPAMVENTCALVLLPDDWVCPDGLQLMTLNQTSALWDNSTFSYKYSENIFQKNCLSKDSWQSMEIAGAVFLLAAGNIDKNGVLSKCGTTGRYWSSTPHTDTKGYYMSFGVAVVPATNITNTINTQSHFNRDNGHSVRLVHDTIP